MAPFAENCMLSSKLFFQSAAQLASSAGNGKQVYIKRPTNVNPTLTFFNIIFTLTQNATGFSADATRFS